MMVQNINGINPINNVQNSRRTNGMERTSITDTSDSINVSDEAIEAARAYFLSQVAEETPDVRSDLVASVKEKIKDPNYLNSVTIGSAADRILDSWGFYLNRLLITLEAEHFVLLFLFSLEEWALYDRFCV